MHARKKPNGQIEHAWLPLTLVLVPAGHGVGSVLPMMLENPGRVTVHCSLWCRLVWLLYDPAKHGSGADEPSLHV